MPGLRLGSGGGFWQMGQQHAQGAINAYGGQHPDRKSKMNPPGKTAGGGIMAGAGGAAAGYSVATSGLFSGGGAAAGGAAGGAGSGAAAGSSGGPYGALIGAGVGLLAYFLS